MPRGLAKSFLLYIWLQYWARLQRSQSCPGHLCTNKDCAPCQWGGCWDPIVVTHALNSKPEGVVYYTYGGLQ